MSTASDVAAAAWAVARLVDANPELPMPSWHLYREGAVEAQCRSGGEVDAWARRFGVTPTTFAYAGLENVGRGSRDFITASEGVPFRFWAPVEVRQVVTA